MTENGRDTADDRGMSGDDAGGGDDARRLELRRRVHVLIAQNPNYFGNLPDLGIAPEVEIVGDTIYEQASCLAYNPDVEVLEATVQVKRSSGYGGDLCSPGSTEWVRFYLSYDNGATWQDIGLGSFKAHDIPDSRDCAGEVTKPLSYTVAHPLPEPIHQSCLRPVLPLVRAILSWSIMPPANQPNWAPVWGNVIDRHVQLRLRPLIFREFVEALGVKKVPTVFQPLLPKFLPEPDPQPLSFATVAEIARTGQVPAHRFAAPIIAEITAGKALSQQRIVEQIAQFKQHDEDWASVVDKYFGDQADTTYEELHCLGLDYNRDLLVATFQVKLPSGYAGAPCWPGSAEYVAFWADYDNTCEWTYIGTAKTGVHDFNPLPPDGLQYWLAVPAQTSEHARGCREPKVGRVRAVLSWATPPSTTDPYDLPRWGNAVETHVEIKPRRVVTDTPEIDVIGGIPLAQIDKASGLTLPFAQFAQWGSPADPWVAARQCPFGGTVTVNADAPASFNAAGRQYRLRWRPYGSASTGNPVTDPFVTSDGVSVTTRTPDPSTGLTPYLPPGQNVFNVLGSWRTRGIVVDGKYEISLEMTDAAGTPISSTMWYAVTVDNTAPAADLTLTTGTPCNKAAPGDTVTGTYTATDAHFGAYALDALPASLSPPPPTHLPVSTTSPALGGTWSLATDGNWAQCGYVVRLQVWDRSIVDSVPWGHNYGYDDVGFCLGL